MAEEIVEEIGLGDVVDLVGLADPPRDRKAAVGEVVEERELGQQALDADERPAGRLREHVVELVEARDRVGRHAEALLVVDELAARAADQDLALAAEQRRPGFVIGARVRVPRLIDDRGRVDRHVALVGLLVLDAARRIQRGHDGNLGNSFAKA